MEVKNSDIKARTVFTVYKILSYFNVAYPMRKILLLFTHGCDESFHRPVGSPPTSNQERKTNERSTIYFYALKYS